MPVFNSTGLCYVISCGEYKRKSYSHCCIPIDGLEHRMLGVSEAKWTCGTEAGTNRQYREHIQSNAVLQKVIYAHV